MTDRLVDRYLRELDHDLRALPRTRRRELVGEIREHIDDALRDGADSESAVRTVLDHLGEPSQIADEAMERLGVVRIKAGPLDVAALILLPLGGLLLYPSMGLIGGLLGWMVGAILLWSSRMWSPIEKVAATLFFPGGLVIPVFLLTTGLSTQRCVPFVVNGHHEVLCTGTNPFTVIGAISLVVPIAMTAYLALRMRARTL